MTDDFRNMGEYYRQFAFVSSVLAGFAFTFYATLLTLARPCRAASWGAFLTVSASVCFLVVTLGTTFAAARVSRLPEGSALPGLLAQQLVPLSMSFILGILFLLASFGLGGWIRSQRLGAATTAVAVLGAIAIFLALSPFLHFPF
jgi:hypothetical protein